jgi:hypothetical protein
MRQGPSVLAPGVIVPIDRNFKIRALHGAFGTKALHSTSGMRGKRSKPIFGLPNIYMDAKTIALNDVPLAADLQKRSHDGPSFIRKAP